MERLSTRLRGLSKLKLYTGPSLSSSALKKKKALLIGINYDMSNVVPEVREEFGKLFNPREDVIQMRELLVQVYGYKPEDITVMLDNSEDRTLLPTQFNIKREIMKLVGDAQPDDRFMFLFSGHSDQIVNLTGSEDDGLDEQLVALDAKIIDNDLNKLLVRSLPPGANLTAIFDSCHSGTMLDLAHYDCNQRYTPWLSKGKRLSEHTRWMTNSRKNATLPHLAMSPQVYSFGQAASVMRRPTDVSVLSLTVTEQEQAPEPEPKPRRWLTNSMKLARARTRRKPRAQSIAVSLAQTAVIASTETAGVFADAKFEDAMWCQSPVSMCVCNGFCPVTPPGDTANVISLAACNDPQEAWEGANGESMTQILIKYLQENPHPQMGKLLDDMSWKLYKVSREVHKWSKRKHRDWVLRGGDHSEPHSHTEQVNFQNFQMGSQRRVDMTETFTL